MLQHSQNIKNNQHKQIRPSNTTACGQITGGFQLQTSIVQYWSHIFKTVHTFSDTEVYVDQTESFGIAFR